MATQATIEAAQKHNWAITEQDIGPDATEGDARRVARQLYSQGWTVEYGIQARDRGMPQEYRDAFRAAVQAAI